MPLIFFYFVHFNCVIDLLFSTSKKASKSINVFICHWTGTQIMSFILHWGDLYPFVFCNIVFFNWTQSLFARKSTKNKNSSFTYSYCMSISTFSHLSFVDDFIFQSQINSCIFFWRWSSSSNQNFCWIQCNWSWALIKFVA